MTHHCLAMADIDLWELHEAYAVTTLYNHAQLETPWGENERQRRCGLARPPLRDVWDPIRWLDAARARAASSSPSGHRRWHGPGPGHGGLLRPPRVEGDPVR